MTDRRRERARTVAKPKMTSEIASSAVVAACHGAWGIEYGVPYS